MAEIAVTLATAAAEKLVGGLVGEMVGEMSLLRGVRGEIQFIIDELETVRSFLKDADEKQARNEGARAWVKQVRQLAYEVEDCLDDFSIHLHLHGRTHPNPLARLGHSLGSLPARHRIATQIQKIKRRVKEVSERRVCYGITTHAASRTDDCADADVRRYDPRISALFTEDSQLVGIDGPRDDLVRLLLDDAKPLSLIAVVGGGGLGKTTIVKKAYDNPNVTSGHFQCRAWITVSQTYNVDAILRDIIKQLISTDDPTSMERVQLIEELKVFEKVQLIEQLRGHLEQKRYLIVFDDVWAIDAWNDLQMALPKDELRSRIILTTRNKGLAESACATPNVHDNIYILNKLTPEQSMDLFLRRVYKNTKQKVCPEDLEELTREILEKCDGLPLAIISIAGVLASKPHKSRREWEEMKSRLGSELEHNPNLEGMSQILTLSYNDLPYNVRPCFLYLSKFPEDYVIGRKRIQRLWVAEGFVSGRHGMTGEEVAESYFNELSNRFMILPSAFSVNGKVKSFRIHDIMLELIVSKSREESFLSLVVGNKDTWMVAHDVIRRMAVHGISQHLEQNFSRQSHVRSLTITGGEMLTLISLLFGMLRVLDLEGCVGLEKKHLKTVATLLHLKYLSLRDTAVDELPGCMERLRKLETLDIRETYIRDLPKGIIKLQQLRFLYGGRWVGRKIPRGIGRLSAMRVLTGINGEMSGKQAMKELHEMTQLQKLAVTDLSEDMMKDFCDSLAAMSSSLRSLSASTRHGPCRLDGLNGLSKPHLLLESLSLWGELEQLPTWILSLSNLVKLRLVRSRLGEDAIQSLGSLPNLIRLSLRGGAFGGGRLCFGAQGFPRLKELHLPIGVGPVSFLEGAMCQLERVHMYDRGRISGITNLQSLKLLTSTKDSSSRTKTEDDGCGWMDGVEVQLALHPNRPKFIKLPL